MLLIITCKVILQQSFQPVPSSTGYTGKGTAVIVQIMEGNATFLNLL